MCCLKNGLLPLWNQSSTSTHGFAAKSKSKSVSILGKCEEKLDRIYNHRLNGEASFFPDPPSCESFSGSTTSALSHHSRLEFLKISQDAWLMLNDDELLGYEVESLDSQPQDEEKDANQETVDSFQRSTYSLNQQRDERTLSTSIEPSVTKLKTGKQLSSERSLSRDRDSIGSTREEKFLKRGGSPHFRREEGLKESRDRHSFHRSRRSRSRSRKRFRSRSRKRSRSDDKKQGFTRGKPSQSTSWSKQATTSRSKHRSRSGHRNRDRSHPADKEYIKDRDNKAERTTSSDSNAELLGKNKTDLQTLASKLKDVEKTKSLSQIRLSSRLEDTKQRRSNPVTPISFILKKKDSKQTTAAAKPVDPVIKSGKAVFKSKTESTPEIIIEALPAPVEKDPGATNTFSTKKKAEENTKKEMAFTDLTAAKHGTRVEIPVQMTQESPQQMKEEPTVINTTQHNFELNASLLSTPPPFPPGTIGLQHLGTPFNSNSIPIPGSLMMNPISPAFQPGYNPAEIPPPVFAMQHDFNQAPPNMAPIHSIDPQLMHMGHQHPFPPPPTFTGHGFSHPPQNIRMGQNILPANMCQRPPPPGMHPQHMRIPTRLPPRNFQGPPRIGFGPRMGMPSMPFQHRQIPPPNAKTMPPTGRPFPGPPPNFCSKAAVCEVSPVISAPPIPSTLPKEIQPCVQQPSKDQDKKESAQNLEVKHSAPNDLDIFPNTTTLQIGKIKKVKFCFALVQTLQNNSDIVEKKKLVAASPSQYPELAIKYKLLCAVKQSSDKPQLCIILPEDQNACKSVINAFFLKYPDWNFESFFQLFEDAFYNIPIEDIEDAYEKHQLLRAGFSQNINAEASEIRQIETNNDEKCPETSEYSHDGGRYKEVGTISVSESDQCNAQTVEVLHGLSQNETAICDRSENSPSMSFQVAVTHPKLTVSAGSVKQTPVNVNEQTDNSELPHLHTKAVLGKSFGNGVELNQVGSSELSATLVNDKEQTVPLEDENVHPSLNQLVATPSFSDSISQTSSLKAINNLSTIEDQVAQSCTSFNEVISAQEQKLENTKIQDKVGSAPGSNEIISPSQEDVVDKSVPLQGTTEETQQLISLPVLIEERTYDHIDQPSFSVVDIVLPEHSEEEMSKSLVNVFVGPHNDDKELAVFKDQVETCARVEHQVTESSPIIEMKSALLLSPTGELKFSGGETPLSFEDIAEENALLLKSSQHTAFTQEFNQDSRISKPNSIQNSENEPELLLENPLDADNLQITGGSDSVGVTAWRDIQNENPKQTKLPRMCRRSQRLKAMNAAQCNSFPPGLDNVLNQDGNIDLTAGEHMGSLGYVAVPSAVYTIAGVNIQNQSSEENVKINPSSEGSNEKSPIFSAIKQRCHEGSLQNNDVQAISTETPKKSSSELTSSSTFEITEDYYHIHFFKKWKRISKTLQFFQENSELIYFINAIKTATLNSTHKFVLMENILCVRYENKTSLHVVALRCCYMYGAIISALAKEIPTLNFALMKNLMNDSLYYITPEDLVLLHDIINSTFDPVRFSDETRVKETISNRKKRKLVIKNLSSFSFLKKILLEIQTTSEEICTLRKLLDESKNITNNRYVIKIGLLCTYTSNINSNSVKICLPKRFGSRVLIVRRIHEKFHDLNAEDLLSFISLSFNDVDLSVINTVIADCQICNGLDKKHDQSNDEILPLVKGKEIAQNKVESTTAEPSEKKRASAPTRLEQPEEFNLIRLPPKIIDFIRKSQSSSNIYRAQIELLAKGQARPESRYCLQGSILCKLGDQKGYKVVIGPPHLKQLLYQLHTEFFHNLSQSDFTKFAKQFLPVIDESISELFDNCRLCQEIRTKGAEIKPVRMELEPNINNSCFTYETPDIVDCAQTVNKHQQPPLLSIPRLLYKDMMRTVYVWQKSCKAYSYKIQRLKLSSSKKKGIYSLVDGVLFSAVSTTKRQKSVINVRLVPCIKTKLICQLHNIFHQWNISELRRFINRWFDVIVTKRAIVSKLKGCKRCTATKSKMEESKKSNVVKEEQPIGDIQTQPARDPLVPSKTFSVPEIIEQKQDMILQNAPVSVQPATHELTRSDVNNKLTTSKMTKTTRNPKIQKCLIQNLKLFSFVKRTVREIQIKSEELGVLHRLLCKSRCGIINQYMLKVGLVCTYTSSTNNRLVKICLPKLDELRILIISRIHERFHSLNADDLLSFISITFNNVDLSVINAVIADCNVCKQLIEKQNKSDDEAMPLVFEGIEIVRNEVESTTAELSENERTTASFNLICLPPKIKDFIRNSQNSSNIYRAQIELIEKDQARLPSRYCLRDSILCKLDDQKGYKVVILPSHLKQLLSLLHIEFFHNLSRSDFTKFSQQFLPVFEDSISELFENCQLCREIRTESAQVKDKPHHKDSLVANENEIGKCALAVNEKCTGEQCKSTLLSVRRLLNKHSNFRRTLYVWQKSCKAYFNKIQRLKLLSSKSDGMYFLIGGVLISTVPISKQHKCVINVRLVPRIRTKLICQLHNVFHKWNTSALLCFINKWFDVTLSKRAIASELKKCKRCTAKKSKVKKSKKSNAVREEQPISDILAHERSSTVSLSDIFEQKREMILQNVSVSSQSSTQALMMLDAKKKLASIKKIIPRIKKWQQSSKFISRMFSGPRLCKDVDQGQFIVSDNILFKIFELKKNRAVKIVLSSVPNIRKLVVHQLHSKYHDLSVEEVFERIKSTFDLSLPLPFVENVISCCKLCNQKVITSHGDCLISDNVERLDKERQEDQEKISIIDKNMVDPMVYLVNEVQNEPKVQLEANSSQNDVDLRIAESSCTIASATIRVELDTIESSNLNEVESKEEHKSTSKPTLPVKDQGSQLQTPDPPSGIRQNETALPISEVPSMNLDITNLKEEVNTNESSVKDRLTIVEDVVETLEEMSKHSKVITLLERLRDECIEENSLSRSPLSETHFTDVTTKEDVTSEICKTPTVCSIETPPLKIQFKSKSLATAPVEGFSSLDETRIKDELNETPTDTEPDTKSHSTTNPSSSTLQIGSVDNSEKTGRVLRKRPNKLNDSLSNVTGSPIGKRIQKRKTVANSPRKGKKTKM